MKQKAYFIAFEELSFGFKKKIDENSGDKL